MKRIAKRLGALSSQSSLLSSTLLWCGIAAVLGLGLSGLAVADPTTAVVISALAIFAICTFVYPLFPVQVAVLIALCAAPVEIPYSIYVGSTSVSLFEIVALIAITRLLTIRLSGGQPWFSRLWPWVLLGSFLAAVLGGTIVAGLAPARDALYDSKPLVDVFLGIVLIWMYLQRAAIASLRHVFLLTLWVSAVLIITASWTGLELNGRSEQARLYSVNGESALGSGSAVRFLTPATTLAVLVVVCSVGAVIFKVCRIRVALAYFSPALLICFLSFSRNQLVGIAFGLAMLTLVAAANRMLTRAAGTILVIACALPLVVGLSASDRVEPDSWIQTQVASYSERVLSGLSSEVEVRDTSTQDRLVEERYGVVAFQSSVVVGHGFGFRYKPLVESQGRFASDGQMYLHNFYLWLLVKSGLLGLLGFVLSVAVALRLGFQSRREFRFVGSMAAVATGVLLAISFFAPIPLGVPSSFVFGLCIGVASWAGAGPSANGRLSLAPLSSVRGAL